MEFYLVAPAPAAPDSMALSFFVVHRQGATFIGHTGSQAGFRSFLFFNPENSAVVIAASTFVAASGFRSRVAALDVRGAGFRIRYAARRDVFCSWSSIGSLVPPRTPLGAWRVITSVGTASLMPSDLSGHERVLDAMVALAGLEFEGRSWRRGGARAPWS